ncbi:MAG: hypothetical protein ACHQY2_05315 [Candidatus Eremiobacterales bacterium]
MTHIRESEMAYCQAGGLGETLRAVFRQYRDAAGDVRWPMVAKVGDMRAARDVIAIVHECEVKDDFARCEVAFGPAEGGPFPRFTGTLTVRGEGASLTRLEIDGTYDAPLGIAGAAFDAAFGARMARWSIRHFLRALSDDVEAANLFALEYGD